MEPLAFEHRTSQIVDPPNGLLPQLSSEGQRRQAARDAWLRDHPADGPEDRLPGERCVANGAIKVGFVQSRANSYFQIVQTPGHVLLRSENMHEARIIALGRRAHAPATIRSWLGDSIGHWEGPTLVIDTTNFHPQSVFRATARLAFSAASFHIVERLTALDADTLQYQVTVDDLTTWTASWTAMTTWKRTSEQIHEYACHEANYGLEGILRGARADEKLTK